MAKTTTFRPGRSGNPRGRPRGIKDKRVALRDLLTPHAQELIDKAVALAKAGDTAALRMCLDRMVPPVRARDLPVQLPVLTGTLSEQGREVLKVMAAGDLTPSEATAIFQSLTAQGRLMELDELEQRIQKLEALHENTGRPNEPRTKN